MISMSQVVTIRQLRKSGESIASISRITGVSRDTVYKYLALDDLSRRCPLSARARR
ncbi:helix-turn-helix domain-containing protein [Trueperella pyogenes]|uniref:helix-turn-helix domain-containing protein n=1 Tax=Trueperella pyogenes TaxID=1661 RepID=UPI001980A467